MLRKKKVWLRIEPHHSIKDVTDTIQDIQRAHPKSDVFLDGDERAVCSWETVADLPPAAPPRQTTLISVESDSGRQRRAALGRPQRPSPSPAKRPRARSSVAKSTKRRAPGRATPATKRPKGSSR